MDSKDYRLLFEALVDVDVDDTKTLALLAYRAKELHAHSESEDGLTLYRVTEGGPGREGRPWQRVRILRQVNAVREYARSQAWIDEYDKRRGRKPSGTYTKVQTVTVKESDWQDWVDPNGTNYLEGY